MRDDIHRRLPLPRVWKRVVRACVRNAEAPVRNLLLEQAARTELRELRPGFVEDARRALVGTEASLFPGDAFKVSAVPTSPIEAALQRECAALADARMPADAALEQAAERALDQRVGAVGRELRAQLSVAMPRDCTELLRRFEQARRKADLRKLVHGYLAGEPCARPQRLGLDLDSDLRSLP